MKISGILAAFDGLDERDKVNGDGLEAIVSDGESLVLAVEDIEGLGGEFCPPSVRQMQRAREAEIARHVVRPEERIARRAGQTVIAGVAVTVSVTRGARGERPSAPGGIDSGEFPSVEDVGGEVMAAVNGRGFPGEGQHRAVSLVSRAVAALGPGQAGGLHQ